MGVFSAGAVGLVLAYSFYRSGSLMWALGFHAAWDYAQSFVWGVADSGVVTPGTLFTSTFHGPAWLTGGSGGARGELADPAGAGDLAPPWPTSPCAVRSASF